MSVSALRRQEARARLGSLESLVTRLSHSRFTLNLSLDVAATVCSQVEFTYSGRGEDLPLTSVSGGYAGYRVVALSE